MKKQLLASAGIAAACVGVVAGVAIIPAGVTKARFHRIDPGMTMDEVVAVFHEPPATTLRYPVRDNSGDFEKSRFVGVWSGDDGSVAFIHFAGTPARVYRTRWEDSTETIADKLRRWVRWPWW
jgi:hypothetical protein